MTDNLHNYIREDAELDINALIIAIQKRMNGHDACNSSLIDILVKAASRIGVSQNYDMQYTYMMAIGNLPIVQLSNSDIEMREFTVEIDKVNKEMDSETVETIKGILRNNIGSFIANGVPAVVISKSMIHAGTELMMQKVGPKNLRVVAAMLAALAIDVENTPVPIPNEDDDDNGPSIH